MKKSLLVLPLLGIATSLILGQTNMKVTKADTSSDAKMKIKSIEGFDDENIALSFFSCSDTHIGYGNDDVLMHNALKTVKENFDIDLLTCCGDITQDGTKENVKSFLDIYQTYYNVHEVPFAVAYGNHDTYWSGCMSTGEFYEALGEEFFSEDISNADSAKLGNRHLVVNGFHFLCAQMASYGPNNNSLSSTTETWLKKELSDCTATNPDQYVFVLTHSPAKGTIVGSKTTDASGEWGASDQLYNILKSYPQAVNLSGHTHYINQTPKFISSAGNFLSIGVPSLCDWTYNTVTQGKTNAAEMTIGDLGSIIANSRTYSYGQIIQIDKNGAMKVTRIDFKNYDFIDNPIVIPACDSKGLSHITAMSDLTRRANNKAPYYDGNRTIDTYYYAEDDIEVRYPSFKDDESVFYYKIEIKTKYGILKNTFVSLAPHYLYPNPDKVPEILTFRIRQIALDGNYQVCVTAYDGWDVASETLTTLIERSIKNDKEIAGMIENRIYDLMDKEEITLEDYEMIKWIRETYNSYDYLIQQYVSNYSEFVRIETDFYNTYFLPNDVHKYEIDINKVYSNAPVKSRGDYKEGKYGGVTFSWNGATLNNSIGINQGYALDSLHMSFTNTNIESEDRKLGFMFSNDIQVKYEKDTYLLVYLDFADGGFYYRNGDINTLIFQSNNLTFTSISHTPFSLRIDVIENKVAFTIETMSTTESGSLDLSYIQSLTGLQNLNDVFVTLTPVGSHQVMSIDVLAVHNGECYDGDNELEEARAHALSEIEIVKQGLDRTEYDETGWSEIETLIGDAISSINSATSIEEINSIMAKLISDINNVSKNNNDSSNDGSSNHEDSSETSVISSETKESKSETGDSSASKDEPSGGCGGSIMAASGLTALLTTMLLGLMFFKKKEC